MAMLFPCSDSIPNHILVRGPMYQQKVVFYHRWCLSSLADKAFTDSYYCYLPRNCLLYMFQSQYVSIDWYAQCTAILHYLHVLRLGTRRRSFLLALCGIMLAAPSLARISLVYSYKVVISQENTAFFSFPVLWLRLAQLPISTPSHWKE